MNPLFQHLLDGDILGFIVACYTTTIGVYFYGIILLIVSVILYNRSKSVGLVSVLWILLGGGFMVVFGLFSPLAIVLVIFGITGMVWSLFTKEV